MNSIFTFLFLLFSFGAFAQADDSFINVKLGQRGSMSEMQPIEIPVDDRDLITIYDSITMYVLDTITNQWVLSQKNGNYIYNSANRLIGMTTFKFVSGNWVNKYLNTYNYGDSNVYVTQQWSNRQWLNYSRQIRKYNSLGLLTYDMKQNWNGSAWHDQTLNLRAYDNQGHLLSREYLYASGNGPLEYSSKYVYTYDDLGREMTYTSLYWWNGAWDESIFQRKIYDQVGKLDSVIRFEKPADLWIPENLLLHTYNSGGQLINKLLKIYINSNWVNNESTTLTYNDNGDRVLYDSKKWQGGQWQNYWYDEQQYNDNHQNTYWASYLWSSNSWLWQSLDLTSYDENGFKTSYSYKGCYDGIREGDSTHYYFNTVVEVEDIKTPKLMIYPNPSSGIYRIESEKPILEFEILDISGKCLLYMRNPEKFFDISIFPKGVYFIKTLSDGQIVINKLVKE